MPSNNRKTDKQKLLHRSVGETLCQRILVVVLFALSFTLSFFCFWFVGNADKNIAMITDTDLSARTIFVNAEFTKADVADIKHIQAVFEEAGRLTFAKIKTDTSVIQAPLLGVNNDVIKNIFLDKNYDIYANRVIVPENMTTQKLGTSIGINVTEYDYSKEPPLPVKQHEIPAVIIGTYDPHSVAGLENHIYADAELVAEAKSLADGNLRKYYTKKPVTTVIIDKYKSVENVCRELNKKGFKTELLLQLNTEFLNLSKLIGVILCTIAVIISMVLFCSIQTRAINRNKSTYGLLKAVGFSDLAVCGINIKNTASIIFYGIIIATPISVIGTKLISKMVFPSYFKPTFMGAFLAGIIIIFIVFCITAVVQVFFIKRVSPISAMKPKGEQDDSLRSFEL